MTVFKVQTYLKAVSDYDSVATYSPDYVWSVMKLPKFWPLPWPKREIGVVMNLRPAEKAAVQKAIAHARVLRRRVKTRIVRITELNGKETKTVIWDNGRYLDSTILPWYWRVFRWLFYAKDKAAKARS